MSIFAAAAVTLRSSVVVLAAAAAVGSSSTYTMLAGPFFDLPELSAEGVLHGLFPRWLARLPLRHDRQESLVVLRRLTDLLARNDAALLGAGGANVPRIVAIFADAHAHQLFDEALRPVAGQLLAQMQSQIPEQLRSAVIAGLSAEQQQCVAQLVAAASSQLPTPPA